MRFVAIVLVVLLGIIYYPLNSLYLLIRDWYLPMKDKDIVIFWAFAPFYWILFALVSIISIPYEKLTEFI
jgi:hypothetical protein